MHRLDSGQCPGCGSAIDAERRKKPRYPRFLSLPEMRYQSAYVWMTLAAALDIILTFIVLNIWDGSEANPLASAVIEHKGFAWAVAFKFALVVLSILMCEIVGRLRDRDGRRLAVACVIISAIPVAYAITLLLRAPDPPIS